jgi:hypothetical protein
MKIHPNPVDGQQVSKLHLVTQISTIIIVILGCLESIRSNWIIKKSKFQVLEIEIYPEGADPNPFTSVWFMFSSIHSVPSQIFTKFLNLKDFYADGQNVRKIKVETFKF